MSVLLIVLALLWMVATEDLSRTDNITSQVLHKLFELQLTLT